MKGHIKHRYSINYLLGVYYIESPIRIRFPIYLPPALWGTRLRGGLQVRSQGLDAMVDTHILV